MESKRINPSVLRKLAVLIFIILSLWWIVIAIISRNQYVDANLAWGASYQLMAVFGAIAGFIVSRYWGGLSSILGRSLTFFSIGLLLQVVGQSVFSFYNLVLQVEIPYPSLADIGYFLSIPAYIYAVILLGKSSGAHLSLKTFGKKVLALIVLGILLAISYFIFLRGYEFDWSNVLRIFLDFGYPLGQAFYVSLAVLVFILSKNYLGGFMRPRTSILLVALIVQYAADFNFLNQAYHGTWINGGYGDYIYLVSYFFMTYALINFGNAFEKIKNS
jgi:hypothetical protein